MHHLILTQSTITDQTDSEKLKKMGFSMAHTPALLVTHTHDPLNSPFTPQTLIVTSKNSIHEIERYNLDPNIKIICVGQSVKNILLEKNFTNITKIFETGIHLIDALQKDPSTFENILYLRGKDVQHDIESVCTSLNIKIQEHITYFSEENPSLQENLQLALSENKTATVCVFSEKGAHALSASLAKIQAQEQHTPQTKRTNLLCLSQRMLNSLEQFEWGRTLICTHPTKKDFLLKLNDLKSTGKDL